MQDELMVTPQELKNTAGSFEQSSRTVKSTTDAMMTKVNSLKSAFEGDAATAYIRPSAGGYEPDRQKDCGTCKRPAGDSVEL